MAKNDPVGDNARRGAVRDRSQVFNPTNQTWTKRDTGNGRAGAIVAIVVGLAGMVLAGLTLARSRRAS